jgi:3-(methylthio)propanoyl-CoA dehydrogenase
MTFRAPVRDITHALVDLAGVGALMGSEHFPDFDADTLQAVLEGGASLADDVIAPTNRAGDQVGSRLENGKVVAAPGFTEAFKAYAEGGWSGLAASPEFGGAGLPRSLATAVFETVSAANMAFGLCPLLSQGAMEAIAAHGSAEQKARFLPNMISGRWTGTMNLTEPQAGSDLAPIRTRAEPDGEGGYRITGQKIFITWGDHEMAENIVHLVLARLPDAPEGVKGISLFLAPKYLLDADGRLGEHNQLRVGSIEHKLGIHGSPTCVMLFEGAKAELIGQPNQGLAHMFTMMNSARLNVGVQGVAVAERAYQQALAFSLERPQGRSAWTGANPSRLFDHPDVRRMLMLMKAKTAAARAICLATAVAGDLAEAGATPEIREAALLRQELFTPVAKAWSTDWGVEAASMGVQIHGGMGFVEETGAAQHYRDARIAPIYEGTNGIQAIDLMGRKLGLGGGAAVKALIAEMREEAKALEGHANEWLHVPGARLAAGVEAVETAAAWLIEHRGHAQPDALAGASPFLKLLGDVMGGWMLGKSARLAAEGLEPEAADYEIRRTRIGLARLYAEHVLSQVPGLAGAVMMGAADLFNTTPEALGA